MKLTTPAHIPEQGIKLDHQSKITLLGSCFAENIGDLLVESKFSVCKNPFGIIYNPYSLANALFRIVENKGYSEEDLILYKEKWLSFDHHGSFSDLDQQQCLKKVNTFLEKAHHHLKESNTLIVTFGSAWVYEYDPFGIVANCHKIPSKDFKKRLLSVKEILAQFETILTQLTNFNPTLNVIFTVSPVRHVKDGLHENNLSKSTLLLAINNLTDQYANCTYFPAYELVMDELRDYRFFKDDLVHPSDMAINYVWEKFSGCYFNSTTQELNSEIANIQRALAHKPFHLNSKEHELFVAKTQHKIKQLQLAYPFLKF